MISAYNSALSGLDAASQRMAVSANNIANQFSTYSDVNGQTTDAPYVPQDIVQASQDNTGGVTTYTKPRNPASIPYFTPDSPQADSNGMVDYPNVSPENEMMNVILASNSYKASVKTLQTQDEMFATLLDIKS